MRTSTAALALLAFTTTGQVIGPGASLELLRLERLEEAMGSLYAVVAYGHDRARLDAAMDAAFDEVHRLDRLLSNYRPDSEWSGVNRDAASRPVQVSDELFDLLAACLEYSRRSQGSFDVTVGPLIKLWGFYKADGALPGHPAVARSLERVGYRHVRLDPAARTVKFLRPGVELDPGGIGKGYAVDRMVQLLKAHGVERALVSAAGSSIYGLGAPPEEPRGWRVTISAPADPGREVAGAYLKNLSISTSGGYEKFFEVDGRRYSHIIDPRTGYPAQGSAAVSVIAARTIESEAWTKPYFVNGRSWGEAHGPKHLRVFFCAVGSPEGCGWIQ